MEDLTLKKLPIVSSRDKIVLPISFRDGVDSGSGKPAENATNSKIFAQNSAPTGGYKAGDLWFDADDNNTVYRANEALEWASVKDGTIAGKTTTFKQAAIPTSLAIGDLWIDSDDGNKLYRAESIGATTIAAGKWVLSADTIVDDGVAPAAPEGLTASAGIQSVFLKWTWNTETDMNHYDIYRHTSDVQADAVKIASVKVNMMFNSELTAAQAYYYWIKAVDRRGNVSGFNATAGTTATPRNVSEADILNNAITAGKISVANLAAINADLGAIIAGTITLPNTGWIKGGQTDYATGIGFFLGYSGAAYKFSVGNDNNYFNYDGTIISLYSNLENAITLDYGSNILLKEGGDIKFTSVTAPTACTATLVTVAGNVDVGAHIYRVTYVNATGETELGTLSNSVTTDANNKQVDLTAIPKSPSGGVTSRKIYRTKADGSNYYLLATIANNTATTYTDNVADASLGVEGGLKSNDSFGKIIINDIVCGNFGSNNTFLGKEAGKNNAGYYNTFIGNMSGITNTTGYFNNFIGLSAGHDNTTGYHNTFIGTSAAMKNTTGYNNIFIGGAAGYYNTVGYKNIIIGVEAGYAITTGSYECVFIGYRAGFKTSGSDGYQNMFIGNYAGYENTTGYYNTFIGNYAGYNNTTGINNVYLGTTAGYYEKGSNKFFVDNATRADEGDGRIKALIYGVFSSTIADQILRFNSSVGINTIDFGSGKVVLAIANASTVPSANPTGGGVIYCEAGALKYRGSGGTITTLGAA